MQTSNGPVGQSLPNRRWNRHLRGTARFVANVALPGALSAAIVRSPIAHGRLEGVDVAAASGLPGVIAVFVAADFEGLCAPWRAEHKVFDGAFVPAETPLASKRVRYVGEPVAIVVAEDALAAQDAAEQVDVQVEPLPPITDPAAALAPGAPLIHPDRADEPQGNLHHTLGKLEADPSAPADVEVEMRLSRVAPQAMETRGLLAHWDPADGTLTVRQSHQHPHMMQDLYSRLLAIPEHKVRVICDDVGGGFGMKQQLHPDEMAAVCASVRLGRPVRFIASRSESLMVDAQARDHSMHASATLDRAAKRVAAMRLDDLCGVGAFGHFPRTSFGEAAMTTRLFGAPYAVPRITARSRLAFQNRPHLGHYRGVGHPVACLVTEALMDKAARALGVDPIALRRRHLHDASKGPVTTSSGIEVDRFRMGECLDALEAALAGARRGRHDHRLYGVGVACLLELVAPGARYYGDGGVNISSDETAVIRMEPSGVVRVSTANTDQGQGADQTLAQIVADVLTISVDDVAVASGDSAHAPYGGGAFGSRQTALGGKAAYDGALRLKERLIATAALFHQRQADMLDLKEGAVVDGSGAPLMTLAELAHTCQFKPHLFPVGHDAGLMVVGRHTPQADAMISSAAFGAQVEVDPATGVVAVCRVVVAHDGGTIINPAAVHAQLQGGAIQGLGQALMEAVRTNDDGQPLTGSYMDYAMPRADNAPSLELIHLPPLAGDAFAPRGVGEAGVSGTPAAILNAVNDALAVVDAEVMTLPATPERVWLALRGAQ